MEGREQIRGKRKSGKVVDHRICHLLREERETVRLFGAWWYNLIHIPNISFLSNIKSEGLGRRFTKLMPFRRAFPGSHDSCAGAGRRGGERADGWTDEW